MSDEPEGKQPNAPAVAPDQEAVFETDDGRSMAAPFQRKTQIDLNGRVFQCVKLTKRDVILELIQDAPSRGERKAITLRDQFQFKGWLFQVVHITPAQMRRKPNGRRKWHPYTLAVRPVAIQKTTAARLEVENTPDNPNAPTGFLIKRTDAGASPIPGVSDVEAFAQAIIEKLVCPDAADELRAAWAQGVQGFFEGRKAGECPWNDSPIIRIGESERDRQARILAAHYWRNGWDQAYKASLEVYAEVTEAEGGELSAEARLALDQEESREVKAREEERPPIVFQRPAAALFERARAFAESRGKAAEDHTLPTVPLPDKARAIEADGQLDREGARARAFCPSCESRAVGTDYDPDIGSFWRCRDCGHCWNYQDDPDRRPPVREITEAELYSTSESGIALDVKESSETPAAGRRPSRGRVSDNEGD